MLTGLITAPNRIELVDEPEPVRSDGLTEQILFEPHIACLCGSDRPYFQGVRGAPLEPGFSLHEMIGVVRDSLCERWQPGDRVLAVPVAQRGCYERYWVDGARAIAVDPRVEPEHAVLAQPLGTVIYGVRKLPSLLDADVVVLGQGPIGQIFNAVLRNLGARRIIGVDPLVERLKPSRRMGANEVLHAPAEEVVDDVLRMTDGRGADVVVEAVGHEAYSLNAAVPLLRHGGTILMFGVPDSLFENLAGWDILRKNARVVFSVETDFERTFPLAMRWLAEGRLDLRPLITHRFSFAEIQSAFETFCHRHDGAQKVMLHFPSAHE